MEKRLENIWRYINIANSTPVRPVAYLNQGSERFVEDLFYGERLYVECVSGVGYTTEYGDGYYGMLDLVAGCPIFANCQLREYSYDFIALLAYICWSECVPLPDIALVARLQYEVCIIKLVLTVLDASFCKVVVSTRHSGYLYYLA